MTTRLPKTLKVGHLKYTIRRVPAKSLDDAVGLCDADTQVISIERGLSETRERNVALHEVLHAIWDAQNLPDRASEEDAVTEIANGLQGLFDMNPRFRQWFAQEFCGGKA